MLPVFVRTPPPLPERSLEPHSERAFPASEADLDAHVQVALASDLAAESSRARLSPPHEFALRRDGPFVPFGALLASSAALREAFAEGTSLPAAVSYRKARGWLFVALLPLLMLAELDRELVVVQAEGAGSRLACDLFLAVAVAVDLARALPRHPRTTSIVLLGVAARFTLFIAKACGRGIHPAIALAALLAIGGSIAVWTRAPTPSQITRALLAHFGIAPDASTATNDTRSPPRDPASRSLVLIATIAALGRPVMLAAAQRCGIGLWPRAVLFAAYAAFIPMALERVLEVRTRPRPPRPSHITLAVIAAFALALGLTNTVHFGFDATAHVARCVSPISGGTAARLLDAETREATRNLQQARDEWAFFAMNVLVVPFAEERVYRDFLQRIFTNRFGRTRAIASASTLFAIAHLDVYRVAIYQMVPLGIACGLAFEEGGLIAAALTHAMWNLHLLV